MEKCPECGAHSLFYDSKVKKAKCSIKSCGFTDSLESKNEYHEEYQKNNEGYKNTKPKIDTEFDASPKIENANL
ncbi:MAG: hypothetical protein BTN85_0786 [Candidatus Methanohalarchaeum thermophilum]|uniref:Uncharacterized protein n=1 Tax=Methanohalarchaeum thermophilum TaxID=1903181 RepID=A0A1Q6DVC8_METT1|nr:MAG: hypothetical protein BTN85_0786 [Candidatus Methanohalarchaeum thermophilum]